MDPLAGSYFVESLTDEIESRAREYIKKIDELGGAIGAIEAQYYQSEIAESAYRYQKAIDEKEKLIVGMNSFTGEKEPLTELLKVDDAIRAEQIERLKSVKRSRDGRKLKEGMDELRNAAEGTGNLIPPMLKAVEAYATVGEISDLLREVWGEYGT